jgi:stalled ribosome alternative rescue factor ArfA
MFVQEEERIKDARGDYINHVKHNKKKNFSNSPQSKKIILMTIRLLLLRGKAKLP